MNGKQTNVSKRQLKKLRWLIKEVEFWQYVTPLNYEENNDVARAKSALMSLESKLTEVLEEV